MSTVTIYIRSIVAEALGVTPEEVEVDEDFMALGVDSMHAIFLLDEIEKHFKVEINPHSFWEYPTISDFSKYLEQELAKSSHP